MTVDPLDKLVQALDRSACNPRPSGSGWSAKCPAHEDKNPSLSFGKGVDARVLVKCHAGCPAETVVARLGLSMSDLFPESPQPKQKSIIDRVYDYVDANGAVIYQVVRYSPKSFKQRRPNGSGGSIWDLKGVERVPYRLPQLLKGVAGGDWVFVVEGEKDADCLVGKGLVATCNSGGAEKFPPSHAGFFSGARVAILPDNDEKGRRHAEQVASILDRSSREVRVVELPGLAYKEDVSDWFIKDGTVEALLHLVAEAPVWSPHVPPPTTSGPDAEDQEYVWPEIVPLTGSGQIEDFPIEVLPPPVRTMVEAVAASTATPIDFPAGVALGAIAAIASQAISIRPTGGDWTLPANLYYCAVLPSGEGKTPVHRELLAPLHEIEREWQEESRDEITAARTKKSIAEHAAEKAAKDAGQGKGSVPRAIELAQEADAIVVPATPRLLTTEPTPEAVLRICGDIGGTLAVVSDEGAEVFQLTSRYSANGTANLGIYLSGFDGGLYISDRVSRDSLRIEHLVLTLVFAIQPSVLGELARENVNRDRGLLPRFFFCVPSSLVGSRPTRRPEIPAEVRANWTGLLRRVASEVHGRTDPVVLELDEEAQEVWWTWCDTVEPRLHPDTGDLRHCIDWGSKASGHVARLAALLHVGSKQPLENPVSADTMRSAIRIWAYFANHAKKAFAVMYESEEVRIARKLLHWVERTGVIEFTQRDAWKGIEGGLVKTVADLVPVLKSLSERGYLRSLASAKSVGRGRPRSPSYTVNPVWHAANIAKNQQGSGLQDRNLRENAVVEEVSEVGPRDPRLEASEGGQALDGGDGEMEPIFDSLSQRCEVCEQPILGDDCQRGLAWHESCRPEPTSEEFDAEYSEEVRT